jgi:hypothetical protein
MALKNAREASADWRRHVEVRLVEDLDEGATGSDADP